MKLNKKNLIIPFYLLISISIQAEEHRDFIQCKSSCDPANDHSLVHRYLNDNIANRHSNHNVWFCGICFYKCLTSPHKTINNPQYDVFKRAAGRLGDERRHFDFPDWAKDFEQHDYSKQESKLLAANIQTFCLKLLEEKED